MTFIQIIEFQTNRIDELQALMDEWLAATEGQRTATRAVTTGDLDRPGTYVQIVEFPSFDVAMENSDLPATSDFAEKMMELCEGPATFRNLDVLRDES
jgi:hypothetical protein